MWGRKEDNLEGESSSSSSLSESTSTRTPVRATPVAAKPVAASSSDAPAGGDRGRAQAQIGKSLKINGTISGQEDLYVDGQIEGTVELEENSLTVGPNGTISADVTAREITVLGRLTGNVHAGERIDIRKTGSLEGDLATSRIVIEDGAVFRGSIDIAKAELKAPARKAAGAAKGGSDGSGKNDAKNGDTDSAKDNAKAGEKSNAKVGGK